MDQRCQVPYDLLRKVRPAYEGSRAVPGSEMSTRSTSPMSGTASGKRLRKWARLPAGWQGSRACAFLRLDAACHRLRRSERASGDRGAGNHREKRLAIRHSRAHTWCCSRPALWEVDPVASPLVGEPGSALYGRSSTTRSTTCSTSGIHRLPAPKAHATASATQRIGSLCPCLWSNVNAGSGRRFRTIVRWSSRSS